MGKAKPVNMRKKDDNKIIIEGNNPFEGTRFMTPSEFGEACAKNRRQNVAHKSKKGKFLDKATKSDSDYR